MSVSSLSVNIASRRLSNGLTAIPHSVTRMKHHGVPVFNHLPLPSITQRGKLGAADFFSTPVDPITAATQGQDLGAGRESIPDPAAETRAEEGTAARELASS